MGRDICFHVDSDVHAKFKEWCQSHGVPMKYMLKALLLKEIGCDDLCVVDLGERKSRKRRWGLWVKKLSRLRPGESVVVQRSEVPESGLHSNVCRVGQRHGMMFSVREGYVVTRVDHEQSSAETTKEE